MSSRKRYSAIEAAQKIFELESEDEIEDSEESEQAELEDGIPTNKSEM